ncbi:MAG: hypothetical protein ABJO02_08310 [Reichenbachiella sp.]|uniref:hypothetical protein n=1 Tax=Reichenbachiella sp. TaxID=2184521 RepID=UPI003297FD5B
MQETKVTISPPYLKPNKKKLERRVLIPVRVYVNGNEKRFNYYLSDVNDSHIYLNTTQLNQRHVINHSKSIRYTSLIRFIENKISTVANEYIQNGQLDVDQLKKYIKNAVNYEFEKEFVESVNNQMVSIQSEQYGAISVDKEVLESFNKIDIPNEPTIDHDGNVEDNNWDREDVENFLLFHQADHDKEKEKLRISKLSTEERYQNDLFDRSNIFELFASIKYDDKIPDTYNKIIIRLFEFRHFRKPPEHVDSLSNIWVTSFFTFLWEHGYTKLNTKIFDPLRFDSAIFHDKEIVNYKLQHFYKLYGIFATVCRKLLTKHQLLNIDFSDKVIEKICKSPSPSLGTRKNHNLTNLEFEDLFFFKFDEKKKQSYQNIFSNFFNKKTEIEIIDLEVARDLFCLQTMAGGLRGYREIQTIVIDKVGEGIFFHMQKINYTQHNPFNVYTKWIAKDWNYQLPKLRFNRSENTLEHIYRALLRTIAAIVSFERKIVTDNKPVSIKKLFNPYFARKTFSQILYDHYSFRPDDISIFTGHSIEGSSSKTLIKNYIDEQSPIKKKKLFDKIKFSDERDKSVSRFLDNR